MNCSCNADLCQPKSVLRKYISKDGDPDMFGYGHYNNDGYYDPDTKTDLSNGRYDLLDGSDTCRACNATIN